MIVPDDDRETGNDIGIDHDILNVDCGFPNLDLSLLSV